MTFKCWKNAINILAGIVLVAFILKKAHAIIFGNREVQVLKDFKIFMKDWCRARQARTDVETVLGPCRNQIKWTYTSNGVRTNASTSFISYWQLKPAGQFSRFFIQAASSDGSLKTTGGDWWRILIHSSTASLRPTVFDLKNGTYEVAFLIMDPGIYHVNITLDYTLCDGFRDPPDNWFILGKLSYPVSIVLFLTFCYYCLSNR